MQTLDAPVYEVDRNSDWYKKTKKRQEDIEIFFKKLKDKFGSVDGFSFYHPEYFGIYGGTKDYELFQNELLKNPDNKGFYPFKKRSKYFKEIKEMLEQIENVSPFRPHDVLGLNNVSASQWLGDRWFFGAKKEKLVQGSEVKLIDYKDYLKIVMATLD